MFEKHSEFVPWLLRNNSAIWPNFKPKTQVRHDEQKKIWQSCKWLENNPYGEKQQTALAEAPAY